MSHSVLTPFFLYLPLAFVAALAAEPIVRNSTFTRGAAPAERLFEGWAVPPDSGWAMTDADGYSGNDSLQGTGAPTQPVTQEISLPAASDLVLIGAMKTDGVGQPVIRLRWVGDEGAEIVRLVARGAPGVWHRSFGEFGTGAGGKAVLELWSDLRRLHSPDRSAPTGKVGFDDVQIVTRQEAQEAMRTLPTDGVLYENLARGKRYTLQPTPGYPHCTDPDDTIQLTDGQYTVGYFWTQKSTVGWVRMQDLIITLDLGAHYPIRGISFNSAAGVAGVKWPASIRIQVSVDGRAYHDLGDLMELSLMPPAPDGTYTVQRFHTDALRAHGRYVKLLITPVGNCTFVDEIEVYRGEDAWFEAALPGPTINYPPEYFDTDPFMATLKRRVGLDLETVRGLLAEAPLPAGLRERLRAEAAELDEAIVQLRSVAPDSFPGVLPFNPVHERVYTLLGEARAAMDQAPLVAWRANPWDYLLPTDLPASPPEPVLSVAAMQGETRACTLNLTNCTAHPMIATLAFDGLPAGFLAEGMRVHDVAWTDTPARVLVAAALPELQARDGRYELALPAGMTRQVWFSVTAIGLEPGNYQGALLVTGATAQALRVPLNIRVYDLRFPTEPRLHVGGWDYTNGYMYGVTPRNRAALIAHLQSRFVDSPWATSGVMAFGEYDAAGQFTQPPGTRSMDAWLRDWPNARRYHVFCRVDALKEPQPDDPLFAEKVGTWIRFWTAHLQTLGIGPERLFLLLVDEPGSIDKDHLIIAWARAIKAAVPAVSIWDDGTRPFERHTPEILAAVDALCPHRPSLLADPDDTRVAMYGTERPAGKELYLYSCWGPTRTLDPYAYYRLQAWSAFQMGGTGSFFWAFGSNGGGSSWNEYVQKSTAFTPLFIGLDDVTPGKHMEAIRESVGDFEYLSLLRDRVRDLEQRQPRHALLPQARTLLAGAAERVLSAPGAGIASYEVGEMRWQATRDRDQADLVRIEIAELLDKLR